MNDLVGQVQFLTGSDRAMKASMDQGGWVDNYLTEMRQRIESLSNQINGLEEGNRRMNDTVRDLGVEIQPSHLEQKLKNLMEKQKESLGQWDGQTTYSIYKRRIK